jgi:hypothetical protein
MLYFLLAVSNAVHFCYNNWKAVICHRKKKISAGKFGEQALSTAKVFRFKIKRKFVPLVYNVRKDNCKGREFCDIFEFYIYSKTR